jgi:hypothetical protein
MCETTKLARRFIQPSITTMVAHAHSSTEKKNKKIVGEVK